MYRIGWLLALLIILVPLQVQASDLNELQTITVAKARIFNSDRQFARQQALQNAQKQATENRLKAFLSVAELDRHRSFLRAEIKRQLPTLAPRQQIIAEGLFADSWYVRTRVQVSDFEISKLLKTLRISQPQLLGKKVITICLNQVAQISQQEYSQISADLFQLLSTIAGTKSANTTENERLASLIKPELSLFEAQARLADARFLTPTTPLVLLCVPSISSDKPIGFVARSRASLNLYLMETASGNLLAESNFSTSLLHENKVKLSKDERYQLINLAAQLSLQKLLLQLRLGKGKQHLFNLLLSFEGFDLPQQKIITDWASQNESFSRVTSLEASEQESFQLQLLSPNDPNQVRRLVDVGLRKQGLLPRIHPLVGNHISFSNARLVE